MPPFLHLIDLTELSEKQVLGIFDRSRRMKADPPHRLFAGKTFLLFFPDSSLRTRISFEKGIRDLGGACVLFPPETLDKEEAPEDVMGYAGNWADACVIRHPSLSKLKELARHGTVPVVNAMTSENHPCEVLSDLFSIAEIRKDYRELTYVFAGPAGNISRSWMQLASVMHLKFKHVCAPGNRLADDGPHYRFASDLEEALTGSDVILTDSLPPLYLHDEYVSKYPITLERMKWANPGALLNPCPPFFRGQEVSEDAMESEHFVGYGFKKNLLYVQQAILAGCLDLEA
ncbi:ornithine carbamoyltransferase [Cohnella caldifontis]|uniref:ornithine carbamoyltransferase n=1 Tax=Cohnella caldifontis TaxID=3027471 RepID=UPI0023EB0CB5|nr:ornithine carbamoyltransferase [Cohnella sp. YIM B05605]